MTCSDCSGRTFRGSEGQSLSFEGDRKKWGRHKQGTGAEQEEGTSLLCVHPGVFTNLKIKERGKCERNLLESVLDARTAIKGGSSVNAGLGPERGLFVWNRPQEGKGVAKKQPGGESVYRAWQEFVGRTSKKTANLENERIFLRGGREKLSMKSGQAKEN